MAGTTWNIFAPNTKIRSSEMNENFDWLEGSLEPMNAGSNTDGAYDLGSIANRWANAFVYDCNVKNGVQFGTSASESPYRIVYDSGLDMYINGQKLAEFTVTEHILSCQSGSSYNNVVKANLNGVEVARGDFKIPAANKLYLDGGGDTYIYESAANTIHFLAGSVLAMQILNAPNQVEIYGECYVDGTITANQVIDRTPYPATKEIAYTAVNSMIMNIERTGVDHNNLSPFVKAEKTRKDKDGKPFQQLGRNLSAMVSAQNEVIKDLIKRIEILEKA